MSTAHEPRRDRQRQDYTDRFAAEFEPRISRDDEQRLTDQAHRREREQRAAAIQRVLAHLAAAQRQVGNAREKLPTLDLNTRRDLDRIRQALGRIRDRYEK